MAGVMSRWGSPKRTQADRERDLVMFCATARIEAVRSSTDAALAARYGVSLHLATYHRQIRMQREPV